MDDGSSGKACRPNRCAAARHLLRKFDSQLAMHLAKVVLGIGIPFQRGSTNSPGAGQLASQFSCKIAPTAAIQDLKYCSGERGHWSAAGPHTRSRLPSEDSLHRSCRLLLLLRP